MEKIIFSLSRNGKMIVLDEPEYGVTDYSGLEATDYELEKSVNTNYIGERLKRKKNTFPANLHRSGFPWCRR